MKVSIDFSEDGRTQPSINLKDTALFKAKALQEELNYLLRLENITAKNKRELKRRFEAMRVEE